MPWEPGSRRAGRALENPYEDVPAHLYGPLSAWIDSLVRPDYSYNERLLAAVCVELRLPAGSGATNQYAYLHHAFEQDSGVMLDAVEVLLDLLSPYGVENLEALLNSANSAYRVNEAGTGLEERVAPGVKQAVAEAVATAAGSAGDHLANAWNEAYGRHQDAVKAYSETIKAVEAALAPRISPQNAKQT